MDETTLAMEEHWPVEEELKLVNQACDQIEQILDDLVQHTACSNHAIRDLLSTCQNTGLTANRAWSGNAKQQPATGGLLTCPWSLTTSRI